MNAQQRAVELRGGWKTQEDELLFTEVERGRKEGKPLKTVFEGVARLTGRKPNSIRNYYYARIKEDESKANHAGHNAAFVPFAKDEIRDLLRTVLTDQANGISVRACTLRMGNGDNKAMLRYQNKYRSVIKTNPELVREVVGKLREEGVNVVDPLESTVRAKRPGRPRKNAQSLVDAISGVVNDLGRVEGLDVTAFFESLGVLAIGAARGAEAMRNLKMLQTQDGTLALREGARIREQNEELRDKLSIQAAELEGQRERFAALLGLFRQLMSINREFLGMNSVVKVSSLSDYIRELSRYVENCERVMIEYVK